MKKIRILNVSFDTEIKNWEIPAFRGAVAQKAGPDNLLFHNHLNGSGFRYGYPLIQYKAIARKPTIQCINAGVDEIHKFFENRTWDLEISGRTLPMKIHRLQMNQFTMQVWNRKWDYSIRDWIALNGVNYQKYLNIESLAEKLRFLEKIMQANILSFAKGIQWEIDKPVEINIKDIRHTGMAKIKDSKLMTFSLTFSTNVFLPNYIGLGKSVSLGFGVVRENRINEKHS